MEEEDVFQAFYSTKLSKRLIHGVSASDEAELSISMLKEAYGVKYTNKLRRMFTGIFLFCCKRQVITHRYRRHEPLQRAHVAEPQGPSGKLEIT